MKLKEEDAEMTLLDFIDYCRTFGTFSALGFFTQLYTTKVSNKKIVITDKDEQCSKDLNEIKDKLKEVNDLQDQFSKKYGQHLNIFG